ncbi:MAG: hypothetical protein WDW36_006472 [Sanguina aurantia]
MVVTGFLAKSDGKDKLTALVQYSCLLISAGEPGNLKKIQASMVSARKVFRIMRPLESLAPVLLQPGFAGTESKFVQALNKLKAALMAIYFGADHLVWAYQIGLTTDKAASERFQKVSLWSWALGSLCAVISESWALTAMALPKEAMEDEAAFQKRQEVAQAKVNQRVITLVHSVIQAALAAGLLQVLPFQPRTVGLLGVAASLINCYMLMPSYPVAAKAKTS